MTDHPNLAAALADLQRNLPHIGKDAQAQYGRYADLADVTKAIMPLLGERGLSFVCTPTLINADAEKPAFVLDYVLRHVSGGEVQGLYPLPASGTPQVIGSAITYARRYALCAVTGCVADEDDDGQAAEKAAAKQPRQRPAARAKDELPRNTDGSVSRSRTTDEELAATGQMTDQQIRDHNKLERDTRATPRKADRLNTTPDDDPWYTESPPAVRPARPAQNPAQAIAMHFGRLGVDDRDVRLGYTARLAGRDTLGTTNDLTAAEGLRVKQALEKCRDLDALALLLEAVPVA